MKRELCFFFFAGHGISEERIQRAFELGKQWFALSNEEKTNYKLDLTEYVGWKGERLLLAGDGELASFCSLSQPQSFMIGSVPVV